MDGRLHIRRPCPSSVCLKYRKSGQEDVELSNRLMAARLWIESSWPFYWFDILEQHSTTILYAETKFCCACSVASPRGS